MMANQTQPRQTASQTAGPYVHLGLVPRLAGVDVYQQELGGAIAGPRAKGERIRIEGVIWDADGASVKDALIEVWQANSEGEYVSSSDLDDFRGWGRISSDFETGLWAFDTIKPGKVLEQTGQVQAPHLNFWLVARGINIGLNTRLYFGDELTANANDPVLASIKSADRRNTLIAVRTEADATPLYRFDIRLQGNRETVFFDL